MPVLVPVPLSQREIFDRRVAEVGWFPFRGPSLLLLDYKRWSCVWIASCLCFSFDPSNGSKALQQCPIPRADQKFKTGDVVEFRFDATIQRTEVRACMC
jgi:hypothetical protein